MSTLRKWGWIQTGAMVVFCLAALVGGYAFIIGSYAFAAINGALMVANFALYQTASKEIAAAIAMRR